MAKHYSATRTAETSQTRKPTYAHMSKYALRLIPLVRNISSYVLQVTECLPNNCCIPKLPLLLSSEADCATRCCSCNKAGLLRNVMLCYVMLWSFLHLIDSVSSACRGSGTPHPTGRRHVYSLFTAAEGRRSTQSSQGRSIHPVFGPRPSPP
jgi:hypothetical protein